MPYPVSSSLEHGFFLRRQWVLVTHRILSQPSAFRVKIWRRLQETGAVSLVDKM